MKRGSIPVAILLVFMVLLSASSGLYAGASFFAQQAPVTVTTTILTTTTSWSTSTIWSTVTAVVLGVWTTVQYTTSTSTITVTGGTTPRAAKSITAYGNARISTAQSKFGGASGLFSGNGAYLSTPDSVDWYFGTGDFTIDFWVRFNALPTSGSAAMFYSQAVNDYNFFRVFIWNGAGTYYWATQLYEGGGATFSWNDYPAGALVVNTWYHVALVRNGNNFNFYKDGTDSGVTHAAADDIPDFAGPLLIAVYKGGSTGYYLKGWLDELRVSEGTARWTSNFTPSTSAPTGDPNTVLLLHMDGADGSNTFIDG